MTKFNVGDKVRVLNKREILGGGHLVDGNTYRVERLLHGHPVIRGRVIVSSEYHTIELVETNATDRRLTEAEAKIATLEAEVKALKVAGVTTNITVNANSQTFDSHLFARKLADALGVTREPSLTPNQRRANVIKRAQAFVAGMYKPHWNEARDKVIGRGGILYTTEFIVNAEKRTVVALIRAYGMKSISAKAVSKCAPDDVFNADIGKAIALGRALGVKVPKEFTDAVKPTEVVVGMRIRRNYFNSNDTYERTIKTFEGNQTRYTTGSFDMTASVNEQSEIIDDTDAVYS